MIRYLPIDIAIEGVGCHAGRGGGGQIFKKKERKERTSEVTVSPEIIPTTNTLFNLFGYFEAMRTCHSKLRYFDWDGQVHLAKGKTGGQQGDPLEILIFNLTIPSVGTGIS
jgi:hypothetical protein